KENFLLKAYELGIIKFGNFTLKSGVESPFYVDLRPLSSSPQLLKTLANNLLDLVEEKPYDLICGVPYAALPMGTTMSLASGIPLIIKRKENKGYGTKRMVEDRKSTRLNSSHVKTSYAVFCLKKKKKQSTPLTGILL